MLQLVLIIKRWILGNSLFGYVFFFVLKTAFLVIWNCTTRIAKFGAHHVKPKLLSLGRNCPESNYFFGETLKPKKIKINETSDFLSPFLKRSDWNSVFKNIFCIQLRKSIDIFLVSLYWLLTHLFHVFKVRVVSTQLK